MISLLMLNVMCEKKYRRWASGLFQGHNRNYAFETTKNIYCYATAVRIDLTKSLSV